MVGFPNWALQINKILYISKSTNEAPTVLVKIAICITLESANIQNFVPVFSQMVLEYTHLFYEEMSHMARAHKHRLWSSDPNDDTLKGRFVL